MSDQVPETQFLDVYQFVDELIAPLYGVTEARINETRWAKTWWAHADVVLRLDSLWRRYEQLRISEPATFLETFLRSHADYHMRYLMRYDGVMADCRRQDMPTLPLPVDPIPEGGEE